MKPYLILFFAATLLWACGPAASSDPANAERPNILWITCEDISPYLGSYGFDQALTPNLDRLAARGIRYTHAYANAPVCAVARATLLSGMYASTLGTQHMRSRPQLPPQIPAYPRLMRQAGYYCTNHSKEDYNSSFLRDSTLWDESSNGAHWKNAPAGKPFFAVFNITVTHESQLSQENIDKYLERKEIPAQPRVHPDSIELPPYHPDLPEVRTDWARFHDLITRMDEIVGERLAELEAAGEADNTIVFFYSDHGGQLSRSKRYIYNVGTQVPLIVYVPEKWRHLAPLEPGFSSDELVSFVDFPKTLLSLAGAEVAPVMQGRIFLGEAAEPAPSYVHFFRDRQGSRYDFSRAITDGQHYFIRNFMPHRPRGRDSRYGYWVQANWRAWESYFESGRANAVQSQFYRPKPPVQQFDTEADPWHVHNLADSPDHLARKEQLESALDRWMIQTRDVGLIPEPMFYELAGPGKSFATLYEYAQSEEAYPIERILAAVKAASEGDPRAMDSYLAFVEDEHPVIRYWGAYALFLLETDTAPALTALEKMASLDPSAANRIMAAQALGKCGKKDLAFETLMKEVSSTQNGYAFLQGINAFQYSQTDERLSKEDWQQFKEQTFSLTDPIDPFGKEYAHRIIDDALELWPQRRKVY